MVCTVCFIVFVLFQMMILVVVATRFRDQCVRCFQIFLVLDFLFIFFFGLLLLLELPLRSLHLPTDFISYCLVCWNFGVGGVCALYLTFPDAAIRFFLVALNVIMATMLIITLSPGVVLALVFLVAAAELLAVMRPDLNRMAPFILPASFQLLYERPRILYHTGSLRLRTMDMVMYGLMAGAIPLSFGVAPAAILTIVAGLALAVFVSPYLGKNHRPLPMALGGLLLVSVIVAFVLFFYNNHNFLQCLCLISF